MHLKYHSWIVGLLMAGTTTFGWAQAPARTENVENTPTVSAPVNAPAGPMTPAQRKRSLKMTSKRLQKEIARADWADDSTLSRIAGHLKQLATDVYLASVGVDAAEQALGKSYLDKYKGYLAKYQAKADLAYQQIDPPLAADPQLRAHETLFQIVLAYAFLKSTDNQPKSNWGEQEFVDLVKMSVDAISESAKSYATIDPDNYAHVERYTEAAKQYEVLWNERQELPVQREIAAKFMQTRWDAYQTLAQSAPGFEDHVAFSQANEAFEWTEMRRQIEFMNLWGFRPRDGGDQNIAEIQRWVAIWPVAHKIALSKQIAAAKAEASSAKYPWSQLQAADRYLRLADAAMLIYPEDATFSNAHLEGMSIRDEKLKVYRASLSSDYHRDHPNSVGLSTTGAIGFQPLTTLKVGEKVVLTIFLDRPAALLNPDGKFEVKIEGTQTYRKFIPCKVAAADLDKPYIDIVLLSDKSFSNDTRVAEEAILREICMADGRTVPMTITVKLPTTGPSATVAPFKFVCDGMQATGIAACRDRWKALNASRLATVALPKAVKSNPTLEAEFGKLFQADKVSAEVKSVLGVRLADADWRGDRNAVTTTFCTARAYIIYERTDGSCHVELAGFRQVAKAGPSSPATYDTEIEDLEVACGNVK
jgi:hypothetical protein